MAGKSTSEKVKLLWKINHGVGGRHLISVFLTVKGGLDDRCQNLLAGQKHWDSR
jgi:hypothetical protein